MNLMNVTDHHAKVGISLAIARGPFVSGDEVRGRFTLESRTEGGLGLGTVSVELTAKQELTSRDHAATSTFIHTCRLFQGPGLPLSNAVLTEAPPESPALPREYHTARKGQTSFFFSFPLPAISPSSIDFGNGLATIKYEVTASVQVFWKGEKRVVVATKPVEVVECLPQLRDHPPMTVVGEGGKIHIQGRVLGLFAVLGQTACVELYVQNHSSKKTNGVTLTVNRKLQLKQPSSQKQPFLVTDTISSIPFNGPEYSVPPGGEGVAHLVFEVPQRAFGARTSGPDDGRTSKALAFLFGVECEVLINIGMGFGSPDIIFSLPLITAHPDTVPAIPNPPPVSSPPALPNGQLAYTPAYVDAYAPVPLEPPRPYFAQSPPVSSPPSPQFYPYVPQSVQPSISPYSPPALVPAHQYFPQYASQPTTPLQHTFASLPPVPPKPSMQEAYAQASAPYSMSLPTEHAFPTNSIPPPPSLPSQPSMPAVQSVAYILSPPGQPNIGSPPPRQGDGSADVISPKRTKGEDGVEGKGAYAAKVSQHLRQTSRTRSVSPTSHRFPVPDPSSPSKRSRPPPIAIPLGNPIVPFAAAPVPQSPLNLAVPLSPTSAEVPTGLTQSGKVASPRPRLSPRLSFDAGINTTANGIKVASLKSKPVEDLERMAEQVLQEERQQRLAGQRISPLLTNKSLPPPPVPSGKENLRSSTTDNIRTFFSIEPKVKADQTGSSTSTSRSVPLKTTPQPTGPSGLDALEKRLAVVDRDKVDAAQQWMSRGRHTTVPLKEPQSPALSNHRREPSGPRVRKRSLSRSSRGSHDENAPPRKESDLPAMPMPKPVGGERSPTPDRQKEREIRRLQAEALNRVGGWMEGVRDRGQDVDMTPWATMKGQQIPKTSSGFVSIKKPPVPISPTTPNTTGDRNPLVGLFVRSEQTGSSTASSSTTRSNRPLPTPPPPTNVISTPLQTAAAAVQTPIVVSKKVERQLMAPSKQLDLAKYDLKSARGGRGGVVTSVTALWENTKPPELQKQVGVVPASKKEPPIFKMPGLPASASMPVSTGQSAKPNDATAAPKMKLLAQTLTPDPKVNGTIAKPYLSSAASIVNAPKPKPRFSADSRKPPTIPESQSTPQMRATSTEPSISPKPQIGVGQAKLKELIAKYQTT